MGKPLAKSERAPVERTDRRQVNLRGYLARADGTTADVSVLDMSYEGCRIDTTAALYAGERIKLAVLRRGAVDAEVRWADGMQAGLVFDGVEIAEPPAKPFWPRRCERICLDAEVTMRRPGKANFRVRVYDLSPDGCKAEFIERPDMEEQLMIKFEGLEGLPAKVIWLERAVGGFRFNRPIHPAVFDMLLERLSPE